MKPVINLNEIKLEKLANPPFGAERGAVGALIGAKKLGYNVTVLSPGKRIGPYHNHRVNEEMFLILEGTGTLRFNEERYPLKPLDVVACPPGGHEVAHIIENTGKTPLKYLALSTREREEIAEYPDSGKVAVLAGEFPTPDLVAVFRAKDQVDYYDGEK